MTLSTRTRRILLVEDDVGLRELIAEALVEDGYAVEIAADGRIALQVATRLPPDLIILDLMLPNMDGEAFSTALRKIPGLEQVPIIIVSASRYSQEISDRVGALIALRKPFDLIELTERVKQVVPPT